MFDPNFQSSVKIEDFNNALVNYFQLPLFLDKPKYFIKNNIWLDYLIDDRVHKRLGTPQTTTLPKEKVPNPLERRFPCEATQGLPLTVFHGREIEESTWNYFATNSSFDRIDIFYENFKWLKDTAIVEFIDSLTVVEKELPKWDKLYVFGDSLSDTGNALNLTEGQFPTFPYGEGRFSNGDIWVDYLSKKLDLDIELFTDDTSQGWNNSLNFAIGGATSGEENVGIVPFGLKQQIDNFKLQSRELEETLDDDLFSVWIGANDYFSFIEDDPTTEEVIETNFPNSDREITGAVIKVVDINIKNAVREIIDAGGENIAIFNLPNIDRTPLAQKLVEKDRVTLQKLTLLHNRYLSNFIEETQVLNPEVNILEIDVDRLFDEILTKPHDFGLTNIVDNYSGIDLYTGNNSSSAEGNPNEYLFFDSVHPTTTAQGLIADLVATQLNKFTVQ